MRKFGPMRQEDVHIYNAKPCAACGKDFAEGDYTTLVALGPGDDEEERQKMDQGKYYNAVCVLVHWDCAKHE